MDIRNYKNLGTVDRSFTHPWKSKPSLNDMLIPSIFSGELRQQFDRVNENQVRDLFKTETATDRCYISSQSEALGWSPDLDPAPERVLRKTSSDPSGVPLTVDITIDPYTAEPLQSTLSRADGEVLRSVTYAEGEPVKISQRRPSARKATIETLEIVVRPNGSLSYEESKRHSV